MQKIVSKHNFDENWIEEDDYEDRKIKRSNLLNRLKFAMWINRNIKINLNMKQMKWKKIINRNQEKPHWS